VTGVDAGADPRPGPSPLPGHWVDIAIASQDLWLREGERVLERYPVSTAAAGCGQQRGSWMTPAGWHRVRARIGAGLPAGAVLKGRRFTGQICDGATYARGVDQDWILTRILWLVGLEPGFNRGGDVDTFRRYIYLHGCPDAVRLGTAGSRGCVRLRNAHILTLFEQVAVGTPVLIRPGDRSEQIRPFPGMVKVPFRQC
jgi:L,D-transpeptidase YbiS